MNDKKVLLECENFPCISWYRNFLLHENIIIEQHEYFERTSFRNRAILAGPNGLVTLSIPILGGRNKKSIMKDLKISYDENWQMLHWKTIESCYRRSPYFEFYADEIHLLFQKKHNFLIDYNLTCLQTINKLLHVKKEICLSTSYNEPSSFFLDLRNAFTAQNFEEVTNVPTYIQVFQEKIGFKNNLSILDMLFCVGKPLVSILKQ